MKTELIIFAILAMVVSSFINSNVSQRSKEDLEATKTRIEKAGKSFTQFKKIKAIATTKIIEKPNEG